ncbi:MAG: monovalent cation:proton antiporter-2 (CPA2) family protein [Geminicoccaceae bacterium]
MHEALIVLLFFIAFAALFDRLRLGTVLGFLIGGAAIGPAGLGVIENLDAVRHLAELGVVFLLFTLGLELKLERLKLFEGRVYVLAITQLLVTAVVIAAMAHALGLPAERSVIMGGALALSSTAIVLQVLRDWGRTLTQLGRMAIAILLVQDIAVGPLLVLVEVLSEDSESILMALGIAALKAVLVLFVVVVVARYLLRPLFDFIATISASEVFTATTLVVVLGASFATEQAGLSMALGAFVAGLMVADTEYRHQVAADIAPFRGLLLGFFFMTVGMTVDLGFAMSHLDAILMVAIGLLLLKAALITGLAIGLGFPTRQSMLLGGLLGQGSEFAFVLLGLAALTGLFVGSDVQLLTVAIAVSMAMTPVMAAFTRRYINQIEGQAAASLKDISASTMDQRNQVVVIGFGQIGMAVTRHLVGLQLPVLALDFDPKRVRASQARKLPIYFGNAARPEVLKAAHVGQAKLAIVALDNEAGAERVVSMIHSLYPKLRIIARSPDAQGVDKLKAAGAKAVVVEGLTTALDIAQRAILLYEPDDEPDIKSESKQAAPASAAVIADDAPGDVGPEAKTPALEAPREPSVHHTADALDSEPIEPEPQPRPRKETVATLLVEPETEEAAKALAPHEQEDPVPS